MRVDSRYCPSCGGGFSPTTRKCPACGVRLVESRAEPIEGASVTEPAVEAGGIASWLERIADEDAHDEPARAATDTATDEPSVAASARGSMIRTLLFIAVMLIFYVLRALFGE